MSETNRKNKLLLLATALCLFSLLSQGCGSSTIVDEVEGEDGGIVKLTDSLWQGDNDTILLPDSGKPLQASLTCDQGCPQGSLCIETADGAACAQDCADSDCPEGLLCVGLGADKLCVDRNARLCMPCLKDADCQVPYLFDQFRCGESSGGGGSYCTVNCDYYFACPAGYICQDRGFGQECFPKEGQCTCSPLAGLMGAMTDCSVSNEFGTCSGIVGCTPSGLTPCNAAVPDDEGDPCSGGQVVEPDLDTDDDGVLDKDDCQPEDPNVYPGALELCNNKDDDCDGEIDEDLGDSDGDGQADCVDADDDDDGTPDEDDCAPLDASIHPGVLEICTGKDDNCDGNKDPEDAAGCIPLAKDSDEDGFGSNDVKCLCSTSGKYTAELKGDCDDSNPKIHPDAEEICDGVDNNCDGSTDPSNLCETTYKICIDPGDGGSQPGAVGIVTEKNVNLAMGLKARDWLQSDTNKTQGGGAWEVLMTRDADVSVALEDRVDYANSQGAERYVSIHNNSCGSCGGHGTETYKKPGAGGNANDLTAKVQAQMVSKLGLTDRGVKEKDFYVLTHTNMAATITFGGFVDTQEDVNVINSSSGQSNAGKAVLHAIQQHFGLGVYTP